MRRFGTVVAAFILVVILVIVEVVIIKGASNYEPVSEVVFAKVMIPEKCEITAEMLEVKKIGIGLVHRSSLKNIVDIVGKRADMDIEAGEMILAGKLGYEGMEPIEVKDKSKRLYSVEFKGDQANGWWLVTDQNVDILYIPSKNAQTAMNDMEALPQDDAGSPVQKLRNIRIAALIDENGKRLEDKNRSTLPRYISFEVTEQQADFLAFAKGSGRLEICVIPQ